MAASSSTGNTPSGNNPLNVDENVEFNAPKTRAGGTKRPFTSTETTIGASDGARKKDVCGSSHSGTGAMKNHLLRCKLYPPNINQAQSLLALNSELTSVGGKDSSVGDTDSLGRKMGIFELWKFNQNDTRLALCKMIIMDERPFRMVEHDGFRLFMSVACPHFIIPSRWTVARDCVRVYLEEKSKLKAYFSKMPSKISLTTDTWTSCQNLGYMVLTAHSIDENWKLQKKILNFCPIVGHTGEIIGKTIENCLIEWGITTKILSVTIDNASADDVGVDYLRDRLV